MAQRMDQQGLSSSIASGTHRVSREKVNAIEVTDGTMGYDGQTKEETAFGYSFLGRTTGAFPGSFTLSMNCAPAKAIAEGKSELRGGSWTLPVYMTEVRGGYAGSLYGTIEKGSMTWDAKEPVPRYTWCLTLVAAPRLGPASAVMPHSWAL